MGYDAFGLPAEQYAVQTGQHPRVTTEANIATMRRQLRALGLGHDSAPGRRDHRPCVLPVDAVDLPADLRHPGTTRTPTAPARSPSCRPSSRPIPSTAGPSSTNASRRELVDSYRLAYLHEAPVNWCPGARYRPRERGGHRRRTQRAWQPSRLPAPAEAVDAAHHRLRRPPARRPRPARLDRLHQADAAQLDRAQHGRVGRLRCRGPRGHVITVFTTRPDTLFGATYMVLAPEHPLVDEIMPTEWPGADVRRGHHRDPGRVEGHLRARTSARPRRCAATASSPRRRASWSVRPRARRRPACSPARSRSTR